MTGRPPAYQHYAKDWLTGTAHLTLEQQGAVQRLLDHQWLAGPLPENTLARLLGLPPRRFRLLWQGIRQHFPAHGPGLVANQRMEEDRNALAAYREQKVNAGRASAQRRGDTIATGAERRGQRDGNGR